jgi:naphthalene 1,2-dioxygenase system ferredoxin subunit
MHHRLRARACSRAAPTRSTRRCSTVVRATDNLCSHGHARLCEGFVDGHEIECPLHQGRFDQRCGKAICASAAQAVRVYPVLLRDGRVFAALQGR